MNLCIILLLEVGIVLFLLYAALTSSFHRIRLNDNRAPSSSNSHIFSAPRTHLPPFITATIITKSTTSTSLLVCDDAGKTSERSESARSVTHDLNTRFVRPAYTTTTTAILDVTAEPASVCFSRICQFSLPRSGKTSESSESASALTNDLNTRFVRPAYAWCVAVRALFDTRPPYDDRIPKRRRHTKPGERERERKRKRKELECTMGDLLSLIGKMIGNCLFGVCTLLIGESVGERASEPRAT